MLETRLPTRLLGTNAVGIDCEGAVSGWSTFETRFPTKLFGMADVGVICEGAVRETDGTEVAPPSPTADKSPPSNPAPELLLDKTGNEGEATGETAPIPNADSTVGTSP
jgi:hypothetical protein